MRKTLESISLDHRRGGEITQGPTENRENAEERLDNKDEVNQVEPGEVERKD